MDDFKVKDREALLRAAAHNLSRIEKAVSLPSSVLQSYASSYYRLCDKTCKILSSLLFFVLSDGITYDVAHQKEMKTALEDMMNSPVLMEKKNQATAATSRGNMSAFMDYCAYCRTTVCQLAITIGGGVVDPQISDWWEAAFARIK